MGVGQRRGCCVPPKKLFFGGTQHPLVRGRKKGKKRERESSQDEPALEKGERQLKSAKIEIVSCREENYRFLQERREREEEEKRKRRKGQERGSNLRRQRLASPPVWMLVAQTTRPLQKKRLRDEL